MSSTHTADRLSRLTQSLSFRSLTIAILTLLMLIPLLFVNDIIQERNSRYHQVLSDISSRWGERQTLTGPLLVVPYVEHIVSINTVTDNKGETRTISKDVYNEKTLVILPQELDITGNMQETYRKRGIYQSLVYTADLTLQGHFNIDVLTQRCRSNCSIKWDRAWISVGLSDTRAITETSRMNWDGTSVGINPGTRIPGLIRNGFHAPLVGTAPQTPLPTFRLRIGLNGSQGLSFSPLGEVTTAKITSSWPHPSFQGQVLPKEQTITADGFIAKWQIPNLARNYPQQWELNTQTQQGGGYRPEFTLGQFTAGVNLFEPVTLYSRIARASKYGILFIALTYLTFLIFELTVQTRPHLIQYILIGLALSLFYLLLVSLAEHTRFLYAYLAAAGVTIIMITLYSAAILTKKRRALWVALLLTGLYGVLYTLLHLEDYALLAGSGLLLVVTGVLMYVTRHINPVLK